MLSRMYRPEEHPSKELYAQLEQGLAPMEREALLEHLEACIPCMDRYLARLEEDPLLEPPPGMEDRIIQAVREDFRLRRRKIIFVNTAKLAVAVCLTMVLSLGGVFTTLSGSQKALLERQSIRQEQTLPEERRSDAVGQLLSDFSVGFRTFARSFNGFPAGLELQPNR